MVPIDIEHRPAWDAWSSRRSGDPPRRTADREVARRIGRPGAARAVGGAVGRNPVGLLVPFHRMVAGDGRWAAMEPPPGRPRGGP